MWRLRAAGASGFNRCIQSGAGCLVVEHTDRDSFAPKSGFQCSSLTHMSRFRPAARHEWARGLAAGVWFGTERPNHQTLGYSVTMPEDRRDPGRWARRRCLGARNVPRLFRHVTSSRVATSRHNRVRVALAERAGDGLGWALSGSILRDIAIGENTGRDRRSPQLLMRFRRCPAIR